MRRKAWPGASLPEFGESSYCLVLGGLDRIKFNKQYPHKRIRRFSSATRPFVACLRRYYLSRGNPKAETTEWSYPPGQLIRPNPQIVYSIPNFASFVDASEAASYCAALNAYCAASVRVLQTVRG